MKPESTRFAPFRLPGFSRLASAYFVNELGNWLGEIALAILVFELTGSPLATAGLFVAMQFAPALATPLVLARIDALSARRALAGLYLLEAAAFCALAALATKGTFVLALVLAVAALDGTLATAARARTRAAAGSVLEPAGLLREGNAILNIGFTAGAAAGPALAGLIVSTAGTQAALLGDAVSFVAVAALLATARYLPGPHLEESSDWRERLQRGFAYVRERPALRRLIGAQAIAFVFFAIVLPIEVVFAKETLDAGDSGYGFLLAAWGTGMVVGSFVFTYLSNVSLAGHLVGGTLAIGLAYAGTGVSPTLAVACAASVLGGAGNGVQWVAVVTAIQELSVDAYQARVIGLLESLASGLSGLGFILGGVIATVLDPRASFIVAGVGVLAVLVVAAIALRDTIWERDVATPPGAPAEAS